MTFVELLPTTMAGVVSVGLAAIFIYADPHSPTTRALALALAMIGLSHGLGVPFTHRYLPDDIPLWLRFHAITESIAAFAFAAWLLRVAQTAQTTERALAGIALSVRLIQIASIVYFGLAFAFPAARMNDFGASIAEPGIFERSGFWLMAVPWLFITAASMVVAAILFYQRIDPAERTRAIATGVAVPFLVSGLMLPKGYGAFSLLVGLLIFLVGAVRYLMIHSEREQFMSRFLSPDVAELVRTRGLAATMQPQTLEITLVCCDLRGFTPYAACHASDQVIRLLREYYEVVGTAVAEFGGTIKDYAGDGILILVGAPLSIADHARKSLALARQVREAAQGIARKWSDDRGALGVGLGVASGLVTVGAIGSASRMEYTAVGSAVNLASRLCQRASDGDILVDARTAELTGTSELESRGSIAVKGFADVAHYALKGTAPE